MNPTYRAGLVVLAALSVGDLSAPLITDGQHPPMSIALVGAALGLVSLVLVALAWRGSRAALVGLVVLRLLSAATAVPAFSVVGVPLVPRLLAGIAVTATVVGTVLVLAGMRRRSVAA